ncbi:MAG: hypothetical protein ACFNQB_08820, partial [Selenomonas noxia]
MAKGKVVQVIGPVVDIEFPAGELPEILNAIKVTGIRTRRVCPPGSGITALDLCVEAAKKLLEHHTLTPSDLGGVLFVTQTPDYDIPNNSSRAADLLGLPHSCTAVE